MRFVQALGEDLENIEMEFSITICSYGVFLFSVHCNFLLRRQSDWKWVFKKSSKLVHFWRPFFSNRQTNSGHPYAKPKQQRWREAAAALPSKPIFLEMKLVMRVNGFSPPP